MARLPIIDPPSGIRRWSDLNASCPDCAARIQLFVWLIYRYVLPSKGSEYLTRGFHIKGVSPQFVISAPKDCCFSAEVEEIYRSNNVRFIKYKCSRHSHVLEEDTYGTFLRSDNKMGMETSIPMEEVDVVPLHPGIELQFTLAALGISQYDLEQASNLDPSEAARLLEGNMELSETILDNLRPLLGSAWNSFRESKLLYDYVKLHGHSPSSATFEQSIRQP